MALFNDFSHPGLVSVCIVTTIVHVYLYIFELTEHIFCILYVTATRYMNTVKFYLRVHATTAYTLYITCKNVGYTYHKCALHEAVCSQCMTA